MAARRNNRRRRRNRGRFGFLYKLLSVLLIFSAILLGCAVFFRVDTIVVTGVGQYSEEQVIQATGVKQGDNLFSLNKFRIYNQIMTQLPYVDTVSVIRRYPDTLVIQITESVPMAVIRSGGEYWLLDAKCKLLERGDASLAEGRAVVLGLDMLAPTVGIPIAVEQEQQSRLDSLKGLLSAIQARGMTGSLTGFVDLTASRVLRFGYGADLTIAMPMNGDYVALTYQLKRTLETMDERNIARTGTLDLTFAETEGAHLLPERWLPDSGIFSAPEPEPEPEPEHTPNDEGA